MSPVFPLSRPGRNAFDWWSLVHVASGMALGLVVGTWWFALGLLVAYEVLEGGLRRVKRKGEGLFAYESWPNIGTDLAVGMVGWVVVALFLPIAHPFWLA